jgi:hypothetical protein
VIPHIINGKDKLFFFFDYEGLRQRKALTQPATVPPADWVAGNFSDISTSIYDPNSRVLNSAGQVISSTPFPNNIIPAGRLSPISAAYFALWMPVVHAAPNALANDFINTEGQPTDNNQENARFDYVQSSNSNWMFRYSHSGETQYNPISIPGQGSNVNVQAHQGVLGFTKVFAANKVNDFKFGISRLENANIPLQAGVLNVVAQLGITGIDSGNPLYWGVPNVSLGGFSAAGNSSDSPFISQNPPQSGWLDGLDRLKGGWLLV